MSLRIVPLALHWQAVSYFAVWPPSLRERPQCGVHLHNSGRSGVQLIYPWTHGTSGSVTDGLLENEIQIASESLILKLTTERTDDEIWVVLV